MGCLGAKRLDSNSLNPEKEDKHIYCIKAVERIQTEKEPSCMTYQHFQCTCLAVLAKVMPYMLI